MHRHLQNSPKDILFKFSSKNANYSWSCNKRIWYNYMSQELSLPVNFKRYFILILHKIAQHYYIQMKHHLKDITTNIATYLNGNSYWILNNVTFTTFKFIFNIQWTFISWAFKWWGDKFEKQGSRVKIWTCFEQHYSL